MTYVIGNILLLGNFFKNKSKLFFYSLVAFCWILIGWCYSNADTVVYNNRYYWSTQFSLNVESGFDILCKLGNRLGLEYQQFLIILTLFSISLLALSIRKYSINPNYVIACYFVFPFVLDAVQVRNFLASSIIVYAVRYLLSGKKRDIVKYIILTLIACTIHFAMYFCLLFILARFFKKRTIWIITICTGAMLTLTTNTNILVTIASKFINPIVVQEILSLKTVDYGRTIRNILCTITVYIIFLILKKIVIRKINYFKKSGVIDNTQYEHYCKYINFVSKLNILVLLVCPLMFLSPEFYRIQQNITVLNYVLFSFYFLKGTKLTLQKLNFICGSLIYSFIPLYVYVIRSSNFDYVFRAIFENNHIFK